MFGKHFTGSTFKHILKRYPLIFVFFIIGITFFLYQNVFGHQFTNWDDGLYIFNNPFLKSLSWESIKGMFTNFLAGNYHPLTLLSLATDYNIGQFTPWVYFLTNLLLHLCNIFLVYRFVKLLLQQHENPGGRINYTALLCALLFAIHPFQVESVAWVSERKNVLYAFFFLISLNIYCKYILKKTTGLYLLVLLFFILSLLSKATAVTLTVCLVCIDFYFNRPVFSRKLLIEKLPFLILSLGFGIIAINAQHSSEAFRESAGMFGLERISVASYGMVMYLVKTVIPFKLSTYYPYPALPGEILPIDFYLSIIVIPLIVFITWRFYKLNRTYFLGALFFLVNIGLVIQLVPVGDAIMADRYMYLPSIGLFFIFSVWVNSLSFKNRWYLQVARLLLLMYALFITHKTYKQIDVWESSLTLWEDAIKKYPDYNDRAYLNRGNIFYNNGDFRLAEADYKKVLEIDFKNSGALIGMGLVRREQNNLTESLDYFDKALTYHQTYEGYTNRAALKISLLDYSGALADLDEAYKLDNYRTGVFNNRGFIFLNTGRYNEAIENFHKALEREPNSYNAFLGLARVKQAIGELTPALEFIDKALAVKQSYEAYTVSSDIKFLMRDIDGARQDLNSAMSINPLKADAYMNRAILELEIKNTDLAFAYYNKAVEIEPDNPQTYLYRGIARIDIGDLKNAVCDLDTSLMLLTNPTSYYYRSIAFNRMGEKTKACNDLKAAMEMGMQQAKAEYNQNCLK